jgi:hypothetical protein
MPAPLGRAAGRCAEAQGGQDFRVGFRDLAGHHSGASDFRQQVFSIMQPLSRRRLREIELVLPRWPTAPSIRADPQLSLAQASTMC